MICDYSGWNFPTNETEKSMTSKERDHELHKEEGEIYSWCEYCREDEICEHCEGNGTRNFTDCFFCEGSGRRIEK